jgi:hypothetical protein
MAENAENKVLSKSTDKHPRKAYYYHLDAKDHPTIIEGLRHYASLYHISLKIGCGYSSLKKYIHEHPELLKVQQEAKESIDEFVESQIVRKCASGYFPALAFYAERRMGWTQHQTFENVNNIPVISFGLIPDSQLPEERGDEEVKQIEAAFLKGDKDASEAASRVNKRAEDESDGGTRSDLYGNSDEDEDIAEDADFFGVSADLGGSIFGL